MCRSLLSRATSAGPRTGTQAASSARRRASGYYPRARSELTASTTQRADDRAPQPPLRPQGLCSRHPYPPRGHQVRPPCIEHGAVADPRSLSSVDAGKNPHTYTRDFVERVAGENMYTNGIISAVTVSPPRSRARSAQAYPPAAGLSRAAQRRDARGVPRACAVHPHEGFGRGRAQRQRCWRGKDGRELMSATVALRSILGRSLSTLCWVSTLDLPEADVGAQSWSNDCTRGRDSVRLPRRRAGTDPQTLRSAACVLFSGALD